LRRTLSTLSQCPLSPGQTKIAILFYNAMRFGMAYQDPGADHYEQKYQERVVKGLHRRAAEFGFTLQAVEGVS